MFLYRLIIYISYISISLPVSHKKKKLGATILMLEEKITTELLIAIPIIAFTLYYLYQGIQGYKTEYRRLPMVEAIDDNIDRAVEMGRPVFMVLGAYANLTGLFAAMTLSGINVMRYTLTLCVRKGARPVLITPIKPEIAPLLDGIYREVATAEGKPEAYAMENIYYFGNDEPAYRTGLLNLIAGQVPATYIACGAIAGSGDRATTVSARSLGAVVIGGQARTTHQGEVGPNSFDYYAPLADVYASGAIVSGDAVMQSVLTASDVVTYIVLALLLVGSILSLAGLDFASWIIM